MSNKTPISERVENAKGSALRKLRRLFKRTPPQREAGWVHISESVPSWKPGDPHVVLELYNGRTDSLSRTHNWSLATLPNVQSEDYYWREIPQPDTTSERHFDYFVRSQRVLG